MFCNECGKELKEGAMFCPECGTKVKVIETVQEEKMSFQAEPMHEQQLYEQSAPVQMQEQPASNGGEINFTQAVR